jgi:hypothetical protein
MSSQGGRRESTGLGWPVRAGRVNAAETITLEAAGSDRAASAYGLQRPQLRAKRGGPLVNTRPQPRQGKSSGSCLRSCHSASRSKIRCRTRFAHGVTTAPAGSGARSFLPPAPKEQREVALPGCPPKHVTDVFVQVVARHTERCCSLVRRERQHEYVSAPIVDAYERGCPGLIGFTKA